LPRVVEGPLLLSLRFREPLIFLYWRFRFERAEAVRAVAARVLLPFQRLFSTPFLVELQPRARAVLGRARFEGGHRVLGRLDAKTGAAMRARQNSR